MNIYLYDACYLLTNIFDTYIIYLFMKLFFKNNFINKKAAISAYTLYYVVTSPVYLFYSVALVNFTVTLLLIFIITLCYKSKISKKIIVAILNQLTFFICEAIVAGFLGVTNIDPLQNTYYGDAFSLIMVELLAFVFIKIIGQFKNLSSYASMPWTFFIIAVLVSVISVVFEVFLFMQKGINETVYFFSLICVLLLNFLIFYLYDSIAKAFTKKIQAEISRQKKLYYQNQAKIIQQNYESTRQLRHDMKNHTIALGELIKNNENEKALEYISSISGTLAPAKIYCDTGILSLDSIVNYKFTIAEKSGISVNSEIAIPYDLNLPSNDLIAIIGNLLDNAVEATSKAEEKYIKFHLEYFKGTIIIFVKNSFDGRLNISDNTYKTTKQDDSAIHGIGLKSIKSAIDNYNGEMVINHTDNEFSVKIILFV